VRKFMAGQFTSPKLESSLTSLVTRVEHGEVTLYDAPTGALRIEDLMDGEHPASVTRRVGKRVHYDFEITRRIHKTLDYCHENSQIGIWTSPFRSGKSYAIREWIHKHPRINVVRLEFNTFITANRVSFIRRMAQSVGVHERGVATNSGDQLFQAVIDRLNVEPALLIFDQAEGAREPVLQVIRQIHDHTHDAGVGVVITGAPILRDRLLNGVGREVGALTGRVGLWAGSDGITHGEMVAVLKAEGIKEISDTAIDLMWRSIAGRTGVLMNAIEMINAKRKGEAINESDADKLIEKLCGYTKVKDQAERRVGRQKAGGR